MNKTEAENYLLDKYTDLIYEYSGLHRKGFKNKRNNRIDLGIMVLKVFRKKMSILTFYFILKWINAFVFYWAGNVLQAIFNIVVSPYNAFKYANEEVSITKGFKDYYFLLKHYKELRAFYNQFVSFKKGFDKEKED